MGSWDSTCAISHLPIEWDDPIRFIFLRGPRWDNTADSHAWEPVTLPIKGIYNGYGAIKGFKETNLTRFQVQVLAKFAASREEVEVRTGDDTMERYPNDLDSLTHVSERGGLELTIPMQEDKDPRVFRVLPYMVREEVYQAMVNGVVATGRERIAAYLHFGKDQRGPARWLATGIETHKSLQEEPYTGENKEAENLIRESRKSMAEFHEYTMTDGKSRELGFLFGEAITHAAEFTALLEFTDEDWDALGQEIFDFHVFCSTMGALRRKFYPAQLMDQVSWYDSEPLAASEALYSLILNEWGPTMKAKHPKEPHG